MPAGSIIVVTRVGLGKVALVPTPLCFSQDSNALIFDPEQINPVYLTYYLKSAVQVFKRIGRGTTISGVTKKQLESVEVFLPPRPEQHRIAVAIETQFSRLDAAIAGLKQLQAKLKRYRAAVLKAAVDGTLTAEWRAQHPDVEPASVLLQRILQKRRAAWERAELAKYTKAGKAPPQGWQEKYPAPVESNTEELPALPDGWCWVSIHQIAELVTDGDHYPPKRAVDGIPHLTARNVQDWKLTDKDCTYISNTDYERVRTRYSPVAGDVIITCVGTLGRTAIVPTNVTTQDGQCRRGSGG